MAETTVLVAGGGASGVLLAARLVQRSESVRVVLVDPHDELGRGMAYATACEAHLLNAPAARMSAFPEEPEHFVRWLAERHPGRFAATSFVPRALYGDYLVAIAARAHDTAGSRLHHVRASATNVVLRGAGVHLTCSSGERIEGDAFVLASGNAAPAWWPGMPTAAPGAQRVFASAWDERALMPQHADEPVLLLGTGLTAIDAVLGLHQNGHRGPVWMVSRRGLLPHEHRLLDAPPAAAHPDGDAIEDLLGYARMLARDARGATTWRAAIDGARPKVNRLWRSMSVRDQRSFVRHALPYWNVHRHRMAPETAKIVADFIATGRLRMLAGRTGEMTSGATVVRVPVRLRGSDEEIVLDVARVINCSGPEHDVRKLANPLMQGLLAQGSLTPTALGIGAEIAPNGALVDRDGVASERLFAIGPVRFGALIETTAIPEIAVQARELADALSPSTKRSPSSTRR
ncbi:MAG TPA: FAD/NAD(P)-binding protein [Candidatus Limnocylindria bacterium]|nr:FAD/NAD(P)-binding protein [Candidatus Limnocylindria bacterium]